MHVIRATEAGFCMGVSLALKKLDQALERQAARNFGRICTLGPIIHNPQVLESYRERGVVQLDEPGEALAGDMVLIRAHGIPLSIELELRRRCEEVCDATCPKVKKAQIAIANATANGGSLLLFGEADHPEVQGLISYARGSSRVFASRAELESLAPDRNWILASQTTQDREAFEKIAKELSERLPSLEILSTICDATRNRQKETMELATRVDVMVIVGGRTSGNTRRLADLCRQTGIPAWHVEGPEELRHQWFSGANRAGLTAGASTPALLIDNVEKWLKENV